jgi:Gig2-like
LNAEAAVPDALLYPLYWSRPQMEARQDGNMVAVRKFLNSFWKHESEGRIWFDPDRDTAYPDRVRRRPPGANSAGLSPHTDSGSIERWLLPAYQQVFRQI